MRINWDEAFSFLLVFLFLLLGHSPILLVSFFSFSSTLCKTTGTLRRTLCFIAYLKINMQINNQSIGMKRLSLNSEHTHQPIRFDSIQTSSSTIVVSMWFYHNYLLLFKIKHQINDDKSKRNVQQTKMKCKKNRQ